MPLAPAGETAATKKLLDVKPGDAQLSTVNEGGGVGASLSASTAHFISAPTLGKGPSLPRMRALFDFAGVEVSDLPFHAEDVIDIVEMCACVSA